ncbi:unnamed protein product [Arctia plantaginis]|uniref:Retroviral polymerase SH3-like domain-containing protein n=1 Tax=Arctia plantaginis TaxID=874455 RepID=A0A8S1BDH2_ARCPL|nr:unnamed protein product [Arctia plantaginis]
MSVNSAIGNKTPFEKWVLRKPCVNHLAPFGSKAFVLKKGPRDNKFAPKTIPGMFIGYSSISKAYRVYGPSKRKSLIFRDVRVVKGNYYSNPNDNVNNFSYNENKHCDSATEMKKTQVDIDDADNSQQNNITKNVVNADSTQHCDNDQEADSDSQQYHEIPDHEDLDDENTAETEPNHYFLETDQQYNCHNGMMTLYWQQLVKSKIYLRTYKQALDSPYKEKWLEAILSEINSLKKIKTWDLVELPKG